MLLAAKTAAATAQHLPQQDQKTCQEGQGHGEHRQIHSTLIRITILVIKIGTMVQSVVQTKKWVRAVTGVLAANLYANDETREKCHQSQEGRGHKHRTWGPRNHVGVEKLPKLMPWSCLKDPRNLLHQRGLSEPPKNSEISPSKQLWSSNPGETPQLYSFFL